MRKIILVLFFCLFTIVVPTAWAAEGAGSGFSFGGSTGSSGGSGSDHGGYSEKSAPKDLTSAINSSWMCVRWMVVGVCYPSDLMVVTHYYPVAYITTPVKKDDTSSDSSSSSGNTSGGSGGGSTTGSQSGGNSGSGTHTRIKKDSKNRSMAWEAIVWQITEDERDDALESWDGCLCDFSESSSGSSSSSSSDSGTCDSYSDGSSSSGSSGGSSGGGSSSGGSGGGSSSGSSDREMWYNSSRDGNNWRNGCRDLNSSSSGSGAGSGTGSGTGGNNMMGSSAYSLTECSGGSTQNTSTMSNESCLGSWGALYPRYTFTAGTTELISSMKIAYRGAHIASNTLSKMPHSVDKQGIMQQADPRSTICMDIGTTPLIVDLLAGVNKDGKYSWIYWRKFGCCKDISSCSGGGGG